MKQNYTTALTLSIPEHGRRLADRVGVVEHLQIFVRFNFGSVEISARRMPHPTTSLAHLAYFVGYTPPTSVSPVPFFCCVATQRRIKTKSGEKVLDQTVTRYLIAATLQSSNARAEVRPY